MTNENKKEKFRHTKKFNFREKHNQMRQTQRKEIV